MAYSIVEIGNGYDTVDSIPFFTSYLYMTGMRITTPLC